MMPSRQCLVAALGYHEVVDQPTESGFQRRSAMSYKLSRRVFGEHLDRVTAGGLAPELATGLDPGTAGRHLLLTFDDGGKSALYAGDELCRRGWRGHFFIVTSLIGGRTFLDADEIRYLHRSGHAIGTHSHTHPDIFRELSAERMRDEWRTSRQVLEDVLGEPCDSGSVPGGDISSTVLRIAAESGLRRLFVSEPWLRPRLVDGCWVFGRFVPKAGTSVRQITDLVSFRGWGRALLQRQVKELVRRTLPLPYRAYVQWQTRSEPIPMSGKGNS
jgi:peptidoglycan/xylan/chitin deacetylase (PgdA/CDA1 family)